MRQPKSEHTSFMQIKKNFGQDDEQPFTILKHILKSPPYCKQGNPFYYKDNRVIVYKLKRQDEFEQMQVEQQPLTTICVRCNTSMQPLLTNSQAKAAMWYITKYLSKNPYKLDRVIPLLHQASLDQIKYGTTAIDDKAASRKAKNLLQKFLNKSGIMEISDQQVAAAVLGYKSFYVVINLPLLRHGLLYNVIEQYIIIEVAICLTLRNL